MVLTLVLEADGALAGKMRRRIGEDKDLRRAVGVCGSVTANDFPDAEVIWEPQQIGDTLTRLDMLL